MKKPNFKILLDKYIKGEASKVETEQIDSFFEGFQQHGINWKDLKRDNKKSVKKEIYKNVLSGINTPKRRYPRLKPVIGIAATITILTGITIGFPLLKDKAVDKSQPVCVKTAYGEKKTVVLPDSSVVHLNAASSLTYPFHFGPKRRNVGLSGEAFFEVQKNPKKPFIIESGEITTTVLGTSFNVHAYTGEEINVSVVTGKVRVEMTNKIGNYAILLPGEQASLKYQSKILNKQHVNIDEFTGWKNNQLHFNNKSLRKIFKILERTYNVKIQCDNSNLLNKSVTSEYNNQSIEEVLSDLQFLLGFKYEIKSNKIEIHNRSSDFQIQDI
jgi:transmembrane sensor